MTEQNNQFAQNAINSLAIIKQDISDNQFDVSKLEVIAADGETLDASVHQDWEVIAKKTIRTLSGSNKMDINCSSKSDYKGEVQAYMSAINNVLPEQLLELFQTSRPFCHCEDFIIDNTSIGLVESCSPCGGSGKVSCGSCGGSGTKSERVHVRDDVTYRTDSHGNRQEITRIPQYENRSYTCSSCGGSGRLTCTPCAGTGRITRVTDIERSAKLHQTYAVEPGKYSDKTIVELMRLPTHTLVNFTEWFLGQSTAQDNHFQIQYVTPLQVTNFVTKIESTKFSFMSFYDRDIDKPHIFDKSPILDTVLSKPLDMAAKSCIKSNQNAGYEFLEHFSNYKILCNIMHELAAKPDYSNKNICTLVAHNSNEYMSEEKQKTLVTGIVKTFKSCVPTYSKLAIILSTFWLLFSYEIVGIPFLPLKRSTHFIDSLIVIFLMMVICVLIGAFISKRIVDKKHAKLPEGIIVPKAKNFKMAFRFAGVFAILGVLSIGIHNFVFEKYFGVSLETKMYPKHITESKIINSSPVTSSAPEASKPKSSAPKSTKKKRGN